MEYSYLITIIRLHIYTYEIFLLDYNNLFTEFIIQSVSVALKTNIEVILPKMLVLSLLIKRI